MIIGLKNKSQPKHCQRNRWSSAVSLPPERGEEEDRPNLQRPMGGGSVTHRPQEAARGDASAARCRGHCAHSPSRWLRTTRT